MTTEQQPRLYRRTHHVNYDEYYDGWWKTSGGPAIVPTNTDSTPSDTSSFFEQLALQTTPTSSSYNVPATTCSETHSSVSSGLTLLSSTCQDLTSTASSLPTAVPVSSIKSTPFSQNSFLITRSESQQVAQPVCIGDGLDAQSLSLIAAIVVPGVIGLLLWVSVILHDPRTECSDGGSSLFSPFSVLDIAKCTGFVNGSYSKSTCSAFLISSTLS